MYICVALFGGGVSKFSSSNVWDITTKIAFVVLGFFREAQCAGKSKTQNSFFGSFSEHEIFLGMCIRFFIQAVHYIMFMVPHTYINIGVKNPSFVPFLSFRFFYECAVVFYIGSTVYYFYGFTYIH